MKNLSFSIIIFLSLLLFGCSSAQDEIGERVLASVGNTELTIEEALKNIPSQILEQDTLSALLTYSEQWVESRVAVNQAERLNIDRTEDFQIRLQRSREQLLESALKSYILREHESDIEVTTEEAQNYFQRHRDRFILDEKYVRFRHITTRSRTQADNANRAIMSGVAWEDVVEEYSINPEYQLRQSTQFFPISIALEHIPTLNSYLDRMGIEERSPIHFDGEHFHFVQLMEEKPAGDHPDFEWLIPNIKEWLKLEKSRRITNAYIRNLYLEAEANNEINLTSVNEIESFFEQP